MKNGLNLKSWLAVAMLGLGVWGEAPAFLGMAEARGEGILSIEPEESIVSPLGGTGSVNIYVTEGARWLAEPMADWLSIPEGAEGIGDGSVTYRAEAKSGEEPRSGQIRMFSPAPIPENEGDSGRTIWFETNAVDLATGSRTITPSFPISFDGTVAKTLAGEVLPQRNENDFAVRLHFQIGELYDINRLMTVFGHSLYLNDGNKLVFEGHVGATTLGTDAAYWVTVSQDQEKNVRVALLKAGESEGTVEIRYAAEEFLHDFTSGTTALGDAFRLGYGTVPSTGYLNNATVFGLEFWERELTDAEAVTMQGGEAVAEAIPVRVADEAIAAHFRLNQNGCYNVGTDGIIKPATDAGISMTGWRDATGRLGLAQRALTSDGAGRFSIADVNNIFHGQYVVNDGYSLDMNHYSYIGHRNGFAGCVPYPVTSSGPFNATYNFWLYLDELPQAPVSIFERLRVSGQETDWGGRYTNSWYANNASLNLIILSSGFLVVSQNGSKNVCDTGALETGCWTMVTFVGEAEQAIAIYKNGEIIGRFDSSLSFGCFPPTDGRIHINTHPAELHGEIVPTVQSFTIGGWQGALDEVTFYDQALTAAQVQELYEAGAPRYVYHTVTQEQRGQTIDFPEIGEQWATNEVELAAVASSGLEVGYEVVSGPGVLDGTVLTFTGPGTVMVEASQAGDGIWWAAEPIRQEVEVSAVPTVVTLGGLEQAYNGEARVVMVETVPEGVAVRVTYDGEEEAPVHAGDYAVRVETADARFSGSAEGVLTVAQATQSIEFPAIGWQVWTNEVVLGATAGSGLAVSYEVMSGPGVLNGDVLGFTGPGTVSVAASQSGDRDWAAAESVVQEVTVGKAAATVTLSGLAQVHDGGAKAVEVETVPEGLSVVVTYAGGEVEPVGAGSYAVVATVVDDVWEGNATGTLVVSKGSQSIVFEEIGEQIATNTVTLGAVASSGLGVAYTVEGPAEVSGNVLTFTGAGTVMVTASQGGDGNWEAAGPVSVSFGVAKAVAEVTLGGLSQLYDGGAKEVEVSTVPEGLSVAVTYDGSAEAPVEAGEYAVAAVVEDAIWEGSAEGTLVITGGAQSIDFPAIGNQVATNTVTLGAVASSGLEVAYAVSGPAEVSGNVLTFTGAGEVTVTASQEGNENWTAAEPVSVSFDVAKAVAEVLLENLEQSFNGEAREAGVSTVPEGLAVAVTYDGSEVAPVNAGEYAVAAVVEDALWEGSAEGTLVIAKGSQRIEFPEIGPQGVTNRVELGATASSGLAVEYAVEGPALLEGAVLTFTGVGTVTVTAKQEGDGNWEAAADVVRAFEVSKGRATVTLEMLEQEYDGAAKVVEVATVPEGLEVAVTYDGAEAAPVNAGRYAVVATVVDDAWEGSATGMLTVSKGRQSIDFAEIGSCGVAERLELEAEASSGLAVTFAVLSGPAILEGGASLRFAETGTVTVAAMQFGDDNWLPAETVRQEFAVVKSVAQVSLEGLAQTFDGTEKSVSVETVPEGLAVVVTYDGAEAAPVDAGSYGVLAVVVDGKWEGSAEGVLTIAKGQQVIVFPEVGAQVATNVVELAAEASSGLPVGYEVVSGPGVLEGRYLSFTGVGTVVVRASQEGDANWEAAEAVSIEIEVGGRLVLTVESAHGAAMPEVGEHEVTIGTVVEAGVSGSPVEIGEGRRAVCTGWRLEGNEPGAGEGTVARFALTNSAVLTWVWETQALVQVEGLAHGTAEGGGWYALGQTATLTAVPEEGHQFTGWEGIVPGGQAGANPVELTVRGPGVAVATFFTTYYVREDGDAAGGGLSWATAKREIASALAEAARGDSVVASNGTYGAVSVPEGVSVRSVEGAEATVIRGGAGVRCVEAAAGAVVEGFSLQGGDVEGDGGGAWLADGAELRRCILRGNKAGGVGGGAYGGTLENCLVSKNAAAQGGGGAAGAELRHCTVVRSTGGGAKDCRSVNCVFWENEGGDVEGGATSWSLCNPAAAGAGNIEGDPCFAGEAGWKLAYESPCIDAAADSAVRVDLDGAPRPQPKVYGEELKPDMGCYEYVPKARFVWEKGSGTPPYESWADAARDIQSALDVSGSGDRVVVEAGTYGAVTVSNAVILMGYRGAAETVIDGRGSERAVTMSGGGMLVGFTVRGGASEDCGGILADGGATVRDVIVEGCRATGAEGVGGGLCLYGGSTAENVAASGNAAAYGGGVWAAETSAVVRCELRGNKASAWGGGAWLGDGSRMEGSVVAENSAVRGAGAYGEDCEIDWCEMTGNVAAGAGGGAAVDGGLFRNNRLSGNRASGGGGLYAKDTDGHDCLVTGNEAGRGAGVWMEGAGQLWNFTVADNAGNGAGVAAGGTTVLGNSIAWGNAGGNLDVEGAAEVRYSCVEPVPEGEGNFAESPAFVGDGDYHLRAGSPCVDAGEVQEWMSSAYDFDGQRRVEVGEEGDGRDIWVDIGADEAALDAVEMPSAGQPFWTWRVVLDANLRLQRAAGLLEGTVWEDVDEPFTATEQTWSVDEPFDGTGARFYRLIWRKK